MSPADQPQGKCAPNSCGTCRQQRVRCDRLLPVCRRCSVMQRKCEGYKRPKGVRWTNSMAIRGKLMGKTTFEEENACAGQGLGLGMTKRNHDKMNPLSFNVGNDISLYRPLIEPGLQDLSPECRNYIRYFDLELSNECVVYNVRSTNPFLALMPLIPTSQALTHIMVSISAFHFSHRRIVHSPGANRIWAEELVWPSDHYEQQLRHPNFSQPLQTALLHKEKALKCMSRELNSASSNRSDGLTAAVILSICLDVVESGEMGWTRHLIGAKELIKRQKAFLGEDHQASRAWLQYFETACTTFDIMGSTLSRSKSPTIFSDAVQVSLLETLQKSEEKTWVGCPAELLYILAAIHSLLSVPTTHNQLNEIFDLHFMLENFSVSAWAAKSPRAEHYSSRLHLASSYKAAVEVYASHVLGVLPGDYYMSPSYISSIIEPAIAHMTSIPESDFHIKSLVWPAFIIGAEAEMEDQRAIIRTIFQNIWVSSCCRNAKNAGEMLERIWNRTTEECMRGTWLQYMYEQDDAWLFV